MFAWKRSKIHLIYTADVDAHLGEGNTFSMRLRPACCAKEVIDRFLVELVIREVLCAREELKLVLVDKVEQHAFL